MSEGLAAVQARVAQLQTMLASSAAPAALSGTGALRGAPGVGGRLGAATPSVSGEQFQGVLQGLDGGDGAAAPASDVLAKGATSVEALRRLMSKGAGTGKTDLGARAVDIAKDYLGVPYRWGGENPKTGLDCSGLTKLVYSKLGVDLPRHSGNQAKVGREVRSVDDARPGDLVFFDKPVDHVGIYVGDGKILHAPRTGKDVQIAKIWETPSHIRRVLPEPAAVGGAGPVARGGTVSAAGVSAPTASGARVSGPYADLFTGAGRKYGVDPALLSAVAKAESGYRSHAVSKAGARGLMQIMPSTAKGLGIDPDDPKQAVVGAARLLGGYLKQYDGRTDLALAAYNAGPGAVRKYGGVPPYDETRTYVQRVTGYWKDLR